MSYRDLRVPVVNNPKYDGFTMTKGTIQVTNKAKKEQIIHGVQNYKTVKNPTERECRKRRR